MKKAYGQRGISSIGILFVMMTGAFFLVCALKLIPIYIGGATVDSSISSAIESGEFEKMPIYKMKLKIGKYFEINRVEGISAQDIIITKSKGVISIDARYEERIELLFNIDVVVKFDKLQYEF